MKKRSILWKYIVYIYLFLLLFSIAPILIQSQYTFPHADDYTFGLNAHLGWINDKSLLSVLNGACKTVKQFYFGWQGGYSGIFTMALQPGIWGNSIYPVTTVLVVCLFVYGNYRLIGSISRIIKLRRIDSIIILALILFYSFHWMPSVLHGVYWYNGAIYYTGFYSIALCLFSRLLDSFYQQNNVWKKVAIILLLIYVEGGNLCVITLTVSIVFFFWLYAILSNHSIRTELSLYFVVAIVCFLINVLAPGYHIRQGATIGGMNAIAAIGRSMLETLFQIKMHTKPFVIPFVLICFVLSYSTEFLKPLSLWKTVLLFLAAFIIYSTQFMPGFYSQGNIGPGSLRNVPFFLYFYFVLFSTCVFSLFLKSLWNVKLKTQYTDITIFILLAVIVPLLFVFNGISSSNSYMAYNNLTSGSAEEYYNQRLKQEKIIERSEQLNDLVVPKITIFPDGLTFDYIELSSSTEDWENTIRASYHSLNSIRTE